MNKQSRLGARDNIIREGHGGQSGTFGSLEVDIKGERRPSGGRNPIICHG